jgi:hypothetical protein
MCVFMHCSTAGPFTALALPNLHTLPHTHTQLQESILSPLDRRSETYRHLAAEAADKQARKDRANARQPVMTLPNILTFLRLVSLKFHVVCLLLALKVLALKSERKKPGIMFSCSFDKFGTLKQIRKCVPSMSTADTHTSQL